MVYITEISSAYSQNESQIADDISEMELAFQEWEDLEFNNTSMKPHVSKKKEIIQKLLNDMYIVLEYISKSKKRSEKDKRDIKYMLYLIKLLSTPMNDSIPKLSI